MFKQKQVDRILKFDPAKNTATMPPSQPIRANGKATAKHGPPPPPPRLFFVSSSTGGNVVGGETPLLQIADRVFESVVSDLVLEERKKAWPSVAIAVTDPPPPPPPMKAQPKLPPPPPPPPPLEEGETDEDGETHKEDSAVAVMKNETHKEDSAVAVVENETHKEDSAVAVVEDETHKADSAPR